METNQSRMDQLPHRLHPANRLHPLIAGAAGSVMLVSLVGVAAITGLLPNSHGNVNPPLASAPSTELTAANSALAPAMAPASSRSAPQKLALGLAENEVEVEAPVVKRVVHKKPVRQVIHHAPRAVARSAPVAHAHQYAQASSDYGRNDYNRQYQQPAQQHYQAAAAQPVYQQSYQQQAPQSAQQASPVGIAAGAVLGGLLGNQVGGGNGRTLATVAGAVGGGYIGNEMGKRYGY